MDLHIHTNLSDGLLNPIEIIEEAIKNKVRIISITDHDTINAYTDDLYKYVESKNIKLINGVEISTKYKGIGIHILGYNFDINNVKLKEKLLLLQKSRINYLYEVSFKLNELGYNIDTDKLSKLETVTKAHIALNVVEDNTNKEKLLKEFGYIPTKGQFIETMMNEGCPAYVKKETITPIEASKLIKEAGGKVVVAHPVAYKYEDNLSDEEILTLVKEINADGIESNYIYIDKKNNKINEINKWNEFARGNNLITTIGSDFHFKDNIHPEIGLKNECLDNVNIDNIINNLL